MKQESRIKNAKRNFAWGLIRQLTNMGVQFITRTILLYYLGVVYLGLNSLFISILQVLSLAEMGFSTAMVYNMYKPLAEEDSEKICALLNLYKKINIIVGSVILLFGLFFLPFLPNLIHGEVPQGVNLYLIYLINIVNTVISYYLFAYKNALLNASQRMDITQKIDIGIMMSLGLSRILILFLFRDYYLYCLLQPAFTVINNLIVSYTTKKVYPNYVSRGNLNKNTKVEIYKQVTGLFVYRFCDVLRNSLDSIILSSFLGLIILGRYNNYYYILNSVSGFLQIFTRSMFAGVGNSIAVETQDKNFNDFENIQFIYMGFSSVCTVVLFCLLQPFMKIWMGEDLMFDQKIMAVFCIYFYVQRWGSVCFMYRQAVGIWWKDKIRPVVEALCNLALNIVLVQYIGVLGVLLSTVITLILINSIWGSWILYRYYFTKYEHWKYLVKLVVYSFVTFLSCISAGRLCSLLPNPSGTVAGVIDLFIRGGISLLSTCALWWMLLRQIQEYAQSIQMIKKNL